jgi:NitT/TauT family transport system ATP-binding protein
MAIKAIGLRKSFISRGQHVLALDGVDLEIGQGEFVALLGPSGSGKSTVLNLIAGIETPTEGRIAFFDPSGKEIIPTLGYMTQQDSLLPWKTALQNVALLSKVKGVDSGAAEQTATRWLAKMGLGAFHSHFPSELSGGMRKRVALAQLLAHQPDVLLLDEPFGALDAQLKLVMQDELLKVWDADKKTVLFVTHDLSEALTLADRVVVFTGRPGKIKLVMNVPLSRPRDVFKDRFTAAFQACYQELWDALDPARANAELGEDNQ